MSQYVHFFKFFVHIGINMYTQSILISYNSSGSKPSSSATILQRLRNSFP